MSDKPCLILEILHKPNKRSAHFVNPNISLTEQQLVKTVFLHLCLCVFTGLMEVKDSYLISN